MVLAWCLPYFTPSNDFRKINYKDDYIPANMYNSYSDLITTAESGLVAHNLVKSYTPIVSEIEKNHSLYFTEK